METTSELLLEAACTGSSSCEFASEVRGTGERLEAVTEVEDEVAAATDAKVVELVVHELGRDTTFVYDSDVPVKLVDTASLVVSLDEVIGRLNVNLLPSEEVVVEVVEIMAVVCVVEGEALECLLGCRVCVGGLEEDEEAEGGGRSGGLLRRAGDVGREVVSLVPPSGEGADMSKVLSGVLKASSIRSCALETDRGVP